MIGGGQMEIFIMRTFGIFRALLCSCIWLAFGIPSVRAQTQSKPVLTEAVVSIGMTVRDIDKAIAFYSDVLSFEKVADAELTGEPCERLTGIFGVRMRVARLKLGKEILELTEYLAPRGRPIPADSRSNDRWFQHTAIVVSDMDEAYKRLRKHKVEHASVGPQRLPDWNKNAAGIQAFYFKDPDGHVLEIIHFPVNRGDARWHAKTDRLFLGIDHTAIVVEDTESSVKFYRDIMGLKIAGESENYGPEQERLNHVFGARLRITTLRAPAGPGIELLEYLSPRDGRPYPKGSKPNDLWHWQPRIETGSISYLEKALRMARTEFISPGIVDSGEHKAGPRQELLIRDPDGHSLLMQHSK